MRIYVYKVSVLIYSMKRGRDVLGTMGKSYLIKLWPGDWEENIDRMNNEVDEYNGIWGTQENV